MRDCGVVVSAGNGMARIRIHGPTGCEDCAAHHLCIGSSRKRGTLEVKNPLQARPGDTVQLDIPESRYNRALIFIFGSLLGSTLAGMGIGWALAGISGLSTSVIIPLGFFFGPVVVAAGLFRKFNPARTPHLYPRIVEITQKGVHHG